MLDNLTVTVDGAGHHAFGSLQRTVLAALAMATVNNLGITLGELAALVYGSDAPAKPKRAVSALIWRLRSVLGKDAIVSGDGAFRLSDIRCSIDVPEFEAAVHRGRALVRRGDDDGAITVLRDALALWRSGPPAELDFAAPEIRRLVELRDGAGEQLAGALARRGDHVTAVDILERIVGTHPDWEHSHARLIECHVALGDLTSARRVHDSACRYLAGQGIEPGTAIDAAGARIAAMRRIPRQRDPADATGSDDDSNRADLPGRQSERQQIVENAWRAWQHRTTLGVLISGEPGIGKSALAEAVVDQLARAEVGPCVVTVRCDARQTLPYAPLAQLVETASRATGGDDTLASVLQSGPESGAPSAEPDAAREHVHASIIDLMRRWCAHQPVLLFVEDAHWCQPQTVALLTAMLEQGADQSLVIIATTREGAAVPEFRRRCTLDVVLRGLTRDAVAGMVGSGPLCDQVDHIARLTGGNPLYIRQLQQAEAVSPDEWPDDLDKAIATHLSILPRDVANTLGIASVVGEHVEVEVLAAIAGRLRAPRPVWIDHLTAAEGFGLLRRRRSDPATFTFVHALLRDHLYRGLTEALRTEAHAAIGRALNRLGWGVQRPADLIAHHYTRGWPQTTTREVVDQLRAAADAAISHLDFRQAADHHRQVLNHLAMDPDVAGHADIARALGDAGRAAAAAGQARAAHALYQSQSDLADRAALPLVKVAATLGMLHLHLHHSDTSSAAIADDLADALVAAADRHAVTDERSLVVEALAAVYVHRPRRAEDLMRHLTAAEPQWGPDLHRALWEHRDVAGQLVTARTLADEPAADPVGSWLRLWVSEVANGQRPLDQSPPPPAAIGTGDDRAQFELTLWRITVSIATGRLARARHRIDQALAAPGHHDAAETARRTTGLYGQRAYLAVICNDVEDARYWSSQAAMPTWTNHHPIMRYVAAYMLARSGERRRADEMCDDLLIEMTDSAVPHSDRLVRLTLLTDVCLAAGHTDGLGQCLAALQEHRGQHAIFHFAQYWGAADCAIGKAQVGLGDLDAGIDSLSEALDQHQRMHAVVQERHNRYELARALAVRARPGDTRSAEEHRRRVCQIEQSCGLPSLDVAASAVAPAWSITAGRAR